MTPNRSTGFAAALSACAALTALSSTAEARPRVVNLDQFDGRWFEIARSPNDVQKDCRRARIDFNPQTRADRYSVVVTCTRRDDDRVEVLRANARVTDPGTNTRFRFTLTGLLGVGGLAGQNYWVQDHAPDYSWAILALPNKSDWWVWHRSQSPSEAERARVLTRARALGLDTAGVVHTGR
ncbi:lipocalin family protein [Brevundimonas sp.]|uniref:lipocalin family protein n=1 Tax=Brevundimonas sp. TaxID=1871086 RepID=UPI00356A6B28